MMDGSLGERKFLHDSESYNSDTFFLVFFWGWLVRRSLFTQWFGAFKVVLLGISPPQETLHEAILKRTQSENNHLFSTIADGPKRENGVLLFFCVFLGGRGGGGHFPTYQNLGKVSSSLESISVAAFSLSLFLEPKSNWVNQCSSQHHMTNFLS